ncbi:uncharacterized protein LOC132698727 [Cylas formicarius]|uniref:uncharacterized protein LOC132698727 n=1 Tax=Cylas formicarius TaxID=197179 RepID=UPI002958DE69|nr:uncharacterized protein LOC132698727 [Cylas formicarius]
MRFLVGFCLALTLCIKGSQGACGDRPNRLLAAEDVCWSSKVEIVERIQHTTKTVLNFAKKKLGLDVDEKPQKCEYYQCIFQEMKLMKANNMPDYELIVKWIDNNIIYNQAKQLYDRLTLCNEALANAIGSDLPFDGTLETSTLAEQTKQQSDCETSLQFLKCLSLAQTECPIFQFP